MNREPVIIIGAGLSGLACAATLKKNNVPFLIFEKTDQIGGRIQTSRTQDGYRLDHGFQALLPSYPELKNFINLKKLNLNFFNSGSLIYLGRTRMLANPFLHFSRFFNELWSDLSTFKDKLLVIKLLFVAWWSQKKSNLRKITTNQFLTDFGFSKNFIQNFWQPFLQGVFLDPELSVPADFFLFLVRSFSQSRVAVPALGMQQIPLQMANNIGLKNIRLNTNVETFDSSHVTLKGGEKIKAKNVVVAFNNNPVENDFFGVQNFYFTTSENIDWGSWLLLVPRTFGFAISTIAVMNHVSPSYGTQPNEHLLSISVVDNQPVSLETVKAELKQISGLQLQDLKLIETFKIPKALPKTSLNVDSGFQISNGVYYCGDWAVSPSINGALESGRLVAEAICNQ